VPLFVSVTMVLDSIKKKKKKKKTKVLELLCNVGRVTEAVEILERLESKGGVVDIVAYNTLIKGFCRLGKMKVRYSFLMEMERKGYLPNIDTYNILISGFCEYRMLDLALVTYDTLIKALCLGGRMEDGFKILELMEESKAGSGSRISPYNSLLYGLYKEN
jgi:pentatricopeptide repeat protein